MKKLQVFLIAVCTFLSIEGLCQTTRIPLSEKSLVKDSAGLVYPYEKWLSMIKTGDYKLEKSKTGSDEYMIIRRERVSNNENKQIYGSNPGNFIGKKIRFPYMTDMTGKDYWNDILKDKIVVLNFWFVKCPPCKAEIPLLNQLYEQYRTYKNVEFIAVCLDNGETISEFMRTNPFIYNQVPSGFQIAKEFNISAYPTNLIIDKGVVKYGTTGYAENNIKKAEVILKQCLSIAE